MKASTLSQMVASRKTKAIGRRLVVEQSNVELFRTNRARLRSARLPNKPLQPSSGSGVLSRVEKLPVHSRSDCRSGRLATVFHEPSFKSLSTRLRPDSRRLHAGRRGPSFVTTHAPRSAGQPPADHHPEIRRNSSRPERVVSDLRMDASCRFQLKT
jgi:hypothetical protein